MGEIDGVIISDGRTVGAITADVIAIVRLKGVFYKAKVLFGFGCVNFFVLFWFFFSFLFVRVCVFGEINNLMKNSNFDLFGELCVLFRV